MKKSSSFFALLTAVALVLGTGGKSQSTEIFDSQSGTKLQDLSLSSKLASLEAQESLEASIEGNANEKERTGDKNKDGHSDQGVTVYHYKVGDEEPVKKSDSDELKKRKAEYKKHTEIKDDDSEDEKKTKVKFKSSAEKTKCEDKQDKDKETKDHEKDDKIHELDNDCDKEHEDNDKKLKKEKENIEKEHISRDEKDAKISKATKDHDDENDKIEDKRDHEHDKAESKHKAETKDVDKVASNCIREAEAPVATPAPVGTPVPVASAPVTNVVF